MMSIIIFEENIFVFVFRIEYVFLNNTKKKDPSKRDLLKIDLHQVFPCFH